MKSVVSWQDSWGKGSFTHTHHHELLNPSDVCSFEVSSDDYVKN